MPRRKAIIGAVLLVLLTGLLTNRVDHLLAKHKDTRLKTGTPLPGDLARLERVIEEIQRNYVKEVDRSTLLKGAISGMVEALDDPYSMYMDSSHYQDLKIHTQGTFGGIGITVGVKGKFITVIAPIEGSPGDKAGIRSGDRIIRVNGKEIVGLPLDKAVEMIRGPEGTQVTLTILRDQDQTFEVTVTRATIEVPTVEGKLRDGGIGYIRIYTFNEKTSQRLNEVLKQLKGQGARGIVLDLRHNPGGRLDSAIKVAEAFVPRGPIVHIVDRHGVKETYNSASEGLGLPLVVLVDQGSASASEIVAGAIQDRRLGLLVGGKTFGKGTVQSIIDLEAGTGLKLTTAQYLTPNGRAINDVGLTPDIQVERGDPQKGDDPQWDPQLEKAVEVLKGQLNGGVSDS